MAPDKICQVRRVWKTPEKVDRHEVTFTVKGVSEPAKAMPLIKETLGKDVGDVGPVKTIFPVQ